MLVVFQGLRFSLLTRWPGAGESGKSTIIKQMRIIHSRGFPEEERHQTRAIIYSNIVIAFKVLLDIMNAEGFEFDDEANTRVLYFILLREILANLLHSRLRIY